MRKLKGFVALTLVMSLMAASLTGWGGSARKKRHSCRNRFQPVKGKEAGNGGQCRICTI